MKLNSKNTDDSRNIIHLLHKCPGLSQEKIAEQLNMSKAAVQRAISRLKESGDIQEQLVLSEINDFFPYRAWISIHVDPKELKKSSFGYDDQHGLLRFLRVGLVTNSDYAEEMKHIVIASGDVVLGADCDIVLNVFAEDITALGNFVTRVLRTMPGVIRTNTATLVASRTK